jgi:D-sedoheptulose 7-phosphate isomerase
MEAIVLCGGIASRLQPIAKDVPKSLLQVGGRPFLEWQLIDLKQKGIERVVLATGHLGDRIEQALGDGSRLGVKLTYSREPNALGTGGALRLAATHVTNWPVLALNGDSYCPFDVTLMAAAQRRTHADATLWLAPAQAGERYGSVEVSSEGAVSSFSEKSPNGAAWISAGVYLLSPRALASVQIAKVASIERDVFPKLAGRLAAVKGPAPVVDIGTPDSLAAAGSMLAGEFRRLEMKASRNATSNVIADHLAATSALQAQVAAECGDQIASAANLIATAFGAGGKLLLCGNGGSAADCQHIAAEFTNRLTAKVERQGLPAIALTTDTSFLTAFTNDYGFEQVFARQVEALGRPGDVLLGISTSGRSRNVLAAFAAATRKGVSTICLCGRGGEMESTADCVIVIPSTDTQLIQEAMLPVEHLVCELVEQSVTT